MNFVFNDFKRRFLNGEVPSADTWTYIPVSDKFKSDFEFKDYKLEQYRTMYDFKLVSDNLYGGKSFNIEGTVEDTGTGKAKYVSVNEDLKVKGTSFLEGKKLQHEWTKVKDDKSFTHKPMFITTENFASFKQYYANSIKNNPKIEEYLKSGFYFIRSKDELEWFAERSNTNSTIIGVIGDNIVGTIDTPIGVDEKNPFNGILDGNYFTLDISLQAKNTDNGIVGVLGPYGIVRNFKLIHNDTSKNSIECQVPITLKYIKKDGRDINCGLLVGRNYGMVENIDASQLNSFTLYGFVPSVYSVTNKSDSYKWNETVNIVRSKYDDRNDNYYFSNSFCINSPGNICPYVGYFAEGKFADDAAAVCIDTSADYFDYYTHKGYLKNKNEYFINLHNTNADGGIDITGNSTGFEYNPLGLYKYNDNDDTLEFISTSDLKNVNYYIMNPLYYGLDSNGHWTTRNIGPRRGDTALTSGDAILPKSILCYNANLIKETYGSEISAISEPSYEMTRCSMRMHPQARAAYNVGVIIGANFGSAQNINVSATIRNTSNFVGFIGGLAGKQAEGYIFNANIAINNQFVYEFDDHPELGGVVYYKQTPILPESTKILLNKLTGIAETAKKEVETQYFSTWYDSGLISDNPVNTAQTVTNDVISYKLKPIFVVGGLFGRYIPTYSVDIHRTLDGTVFTGCIVNGVRVVYDDNYCSLDSTATKNIENAFGVMIGKVDYESQTNTISYDTSLQCYNSVFSAVNFVGEPFKVYENSYDDEVGFTPIIVNNGDTSAVLENDIAKKFVGIFELKYNVLNSVVYNAYNDSSNSSKSPQKLTAYSLFDMCDYPIDLKSHEGGILQTHILSNFVSGYMPGIGKNGEEYNTMEYEDTVTSNPNYDHWHQYFMSPTINLGALPANYGSPDAAPGINKRNMAIRLINMTNCRSNISDYIQLYDDYVSNYNLNKIPFSANSLSSQEQIYAIGKWWSYYRTNNDKMCNSDYSEISDNIKWDDTKANFDEYKLYFAPGLDTYNINQYLENGIQNTFDGYTTVQFNANSDLQQWYNNNTVSGIQDNFLNLNDEDCIDGGPGVNSNVRFKATEVNCLIYKTNEENVQHLTFNTYRLYKKNILSVRSTNLTSQPLTTMEFNKLDWIERPEDDFYFYYDYENEEGPENQITNRFVPLSDAFAFTNEVKYDVVTNENTGVLGYFTNKENDNDNKIQIGEYYTPEEIRANITKNELQGHPVFVTSSVSSKNNFAGILVVDSSGRNVMYYDNDNPTQLTGNSVYYPCPIYTTKKLLLEIQ